jgi:hypothetical protein
LTSHAISSANFHDVQESRTMNLSIATVLFAAIVASLIVRPTPQDQAVPVAVAKADRLSIQPARSRCAQQNWPNFDAACLRYTWKELRMLPAWHRLCDPIRGKARVRRQGVATGSR